MEEHWFDALHKTLLQRASRQTTLRAAAASVASLALGAVSGAEAKKNRKKGKKGKKGKKDKPKKKCVPPPSTCSGGACQAINWATDPEKQCRELNHCESVCNQCDGDDPREFCIRDGVQLDGSATKVAECCAEDNVCCDGGCCGRPNSDSRFHCCGGSCIDTKSDRDHCGGCDQPCPGGACVDGGCVCTDGQIECNGACVDGTECPADVCGGRCAALGLECCGGRFCYDSTQSECCAPPNLGLCPRPSTHCCTSPNGINYCRANGEPC